MKKLLILLVMSGFILPGVVLASIDTNLKYGSHGAKVIELQEFLIDKGFLTGQASGNFFALTRKAVIAWQTSAGLPATGFVGAMSRAKINEELSVANALAVEAEKREATTTARTNIAPVANKTSTLPNGAIVEIDTSGNIVRFITTAPVFQPAPASVSITLPPTSQTTLTTNTPTVTLPTSPVPQVIKIHETIGSLNIDDTNNVNLTARAGVDPIYFDAQTLNVYGDQINSVFPVVVTTDDPDLPPTFNINPNVAGFYVGKHIDNTHIQQNNNCVGGESCLPQSVGTFTFTFSLPNLNLSKSVHVTIVNYVPSKILVSLSPHTTASKQISVGVDGAHNASVVTYNIRTSSPNDYLYVSDLKFTVSDPGTVKTISIENNTAPVIDGVAYSTGILSPLIGLGGRDFVANISYSPIGTTVPSGTQSTVTLSYIKGVLNRMPITLCASGCTQILPSLPAPTMTLVGQ